MPVMLESPPVHTSRIQVQERRPSSVRGWRLLPLGQGFYYVLTGVWPLLGLRSFQRVTGPKTDVWLVQTVGMLVLIIGATLMSAAVRGRVSEPIRRLGVGSALGLLLMELLYGFNGTISSIYVADAALQAIIVVWWFSRIE